MLVSLAVGGAAYAASGATTPKATSTRLLGLALSATSNFNGTQPSGTIRLTQANNDPNLV